MKEKKAYSGDRVRGQTRVYVEDGLERTHQDRQRCLPHIVFNTPHFDWGCANKGSEELAACILRDLTGLMPEPGTRVAFELMVIAKLHNDEWRLSEDQIRLWLHDRK